jgi:hypothetical protein
MALLPMTDLEDHHPTTTHQYNLLLPWQICLQPPAAKHEVARNAWHVQLKAPLANSARKQAANHSSCTMEKHIICDLILGTLNKDQQQ